MRSRRAPPRGVQAGRVIQARNLPPSCANGFRHLRRRSTARGIRCTTRSNSGPALSPALSMHLASSGLEVLRASVRLARNHHVRLLVVVRARRIYLPGEDGGGARWSAGARAGASAHTCLAASPEGESEVCREEEAPRGGSPRGPGLGEAPTSSHVTSTVVRRWSSAEGATSCASATASSSR